MAKNLLFWVPPAVIAGIFALLVFNMNIWEAALGALFPGQEQVVYPRADLAELCGQHLFLVGVSGIAAVSIGVPLGIFVTRERGSGFKSIVSDLGSLSQTVPPVAVLALAVPAIGFGFEPTVLALFLYSLLPILRNTVAGLDGVSPAIKEAARGMGMTRRQVLLKVEIPIASRVIFAGIRISLVMNVGTAAVGATVGAGGLGNPIVSGLIRDNPAFVLEGGITAALLALLIDLIVGRVEKSLSPA